VYKVVFNHHQHNYLCVLIDQVTGLRVSWSSSGHSIFTNEITIARLFLYG